MPGGKFITFEGIEGSGKTSHLRRLSCYLAESGVRHIVTREPGGTQFGQEGRAVAICKKDRRLKAASKRRTWISTAASRKDIDSSQNWSQDDFTSSIPAENLTRLRRRCAKS